MTQAIHLGRLSTAVWPGRVSAEDMYVDIPQVVSRLDEFYVPTSDSAKTRCIDGRHDPELDETHLGPQVPGGATGAALAYRLGVDKDDLTRGTFYADFESMLAQYRRLGLTPGGHRDNDTAREHGVGCGAIDGVETVLACLTDPRLVEDHKRLVRSILDVSFYRDDYLRILGAGQVLFGHATEYFSKNDQILELLETTCPGSVATLAGTHNEKLVIINFVPNTTLSSNRFAQEFGGMQAFGYDVWRSRQLAEMILPLESQLIDRDRFIVARVSITVATLMALTDGSLQLLLRVA
jgi:hypothetical protein